MYLLEAESYMESFIDIPMVDYLFEDAQSISNIDHENDKVSKGVVSSLKKAFQTLIRVVKDIIKKFTNFIKEVVMSSDEKARYKKFKAAIANDPEFAKTEVYVEDFRLYEKIYDKALKDLESEAKKETPDIAKCEKIISDMDKEVDTMKEKVEVVQHKGVEKVKSMAARAAYATALDTALEIANRNTLCAKGINIALENELVALNEAEKSLGDKAIHRFQKKVKKYSNAGFFHRFKVRILQRKSTTLSGVIKDQFKKIASYTNYDTKTGKFKKGKQPISNTSITKGMIKHPGLTRRYLGGTKEYVKNLKQQAGNSAVDTISLPLTRQKSKRIKRDIGDLKHFFTGK